MIFDSLGFWPGEMLKAGDGFQEHPAFGGGDHGIHLPSDQFCFDQFWPFKSLALRAWSPVSCEHFCLARVLSLRMWSCDKPRKTPALVLDRSIQGLGSNPLGLGFHLHLELSTEMSLLEKL